MNTVFFLFIITVDAQVKYYTSTGQLSFNKEDAKEFQTLQQATREADASEIKLKPAARFAHFSLI